MRHFLVLAATGAAMLLVTQAAAAAAEPALSFKDAQLGMTLAQWRSAPPPPGVGPDATAACSRDERIVRVAGNPLSAAARETGFQGCAYVAIFGQDVLPHSVVLDPTYRASGLRYLFDRGRLAEIRFDASIDAYDDVMAQLARTYGPPSSTRRDEVRTAIGRIARVRQTWLEPGEGEVTLVDPVSPLNELRVVFAAPAALRPSSKLAAGEPRQGG